MNPNIKAEEVVAIFQRYLTTNDDTEVAKLSLADIRSADEQLGQRDVGAGFRIAMLNRIADLEKMGEQKRDSKLRALDYVMGIITGLVIAGIAILLF